MSSYSNVIGGKLKLKGVTITKKKKVSKKETEEKIVKVIEEKETQQTESETKIKEEVKKILEDKRTPAERRYDEIMAKREQERIAKQAIKSHRQKIEEFNKHLDKLSEHYDIPKVGPG